MHSTVHRVTVGFSKGPRMDAEGRGRKHWEITERVLAAFYSVLRELGSGFAESVYREAITVVLEEDGLNVAREFPLEVRFRGRVVGRFRADLLIAGKVLVELKAVRSLDASHEGQLLNYLRCSLIEVGLLLNFRARPKSSASYSPTTGRPVRGGQRWSANRGAIRASPRHPWSLIGSLLLLRIVEAPKLQQPTCGRPADVGRISQLRRLRRTSASTLQ